MKSKSKSSLKDWFQEARESKFQENLQVGKSHDWEGLGFSIKVLAD